MLDNFNRANGGAGSNWALIRPSGFATMNVSGNAAVDSSSSAFAWNYWVPATYGPDSEAYVTVKTYGAGDVIRVGARVTSAGSSDSGYYVSVSAAGVWSILRIDHTSSVTLVTGPTQALANGDKVAIRVVGSVVTALHYTQAGRWLQVLSYDTINDATRYTTAGSLALEFKSSALDDFGGGTVVSASPPANTGSPTVSGTPTEGQLLTASPGTWTGSPAPTFTYQWQRCDTQGANCSNIGGATNPTYTLVTADVGSTIDVQVTGNNPSGQATATSQPTSSIAAAPTPPANTGSPTVSGTPTEGQLLTASPGTWTGSPAPTFTYQWQRCDTQGANCSNIGGATNPTYTLVTADVGSTIDVQVTGNNPSGQATATSQPTSSIAAAPTPPANTGSPTVSGTPTEGQLLTASPGTWTGSPAPTFTYQWQRCDSRAPTARHRRRHRPTTRWSQPTSAPPSTSRSPATTPPDRPRHQPTHQQHRRGPHPAREHGLADGLRHPRRGSADRVAGHLDGFAGTDVHLPVAALRHAGANCANIGGATNPTYTLVSSRRRLHHRVQVTGNNPSGRPPPPPTRPQLVAARTRRRTRASRRSRAQPTDGQS